MTARGQLNRRLHDNVKACHNTFMSISRVRSSRVFAISFPENLAKQMEDVARDEYRNISELFLTRRIISPLLFKSFDVSSYSVAEAATQKS
jgi:hypothetical protein